MIRFVLLFFIIAGLTGCATVKKETISQLQLQVSEMEVQLAQNQQEIQSLQGRSERRSGKSYTRQSSDSSESADEVKSKEEAEVVRVAASVGQVQIALKKAGYYSGAIDSKLGPNTKNAIASFQKDHNLNPDGVVGQKTWIALKQYTE